MPAPTSDRPDLTGQTAVITGAAGGIGSAVAESLAREGADIVAVDIDETSLGRTRRRVESIDQLCETVVCDITDKAGIEAIFDAAVSEFDTIEVVVTAAGVTSRDLSIDESMDDWSHVLATNLTATYETCRVFFDHMVDNGYGKFVTIGSIAGRTGRPPAGPSYTASKGGVHAVTRWLATRGARHGVYANAIAPGPIRTAMTDRGRDVPTGDQPLGRIGEPEDVAQAALFLCSQQSNWITGTTLDVNGGQLAV